MSSDDGSSSYHEEDEIMTEAGGGGVVNGGYSDDDVETTTVARTKTKSKPKAKRKAAASIEANNDDGNGSGGAIRKKPKASKKAVRANNDDDGQPIVAERGILLRVELVNFLCHRHVSIDLGPHINFIHGQNGSGKSAILVAIQTCLGCKASATNRGSCIKDLITDGESAGAVTITIKNEGDEAYRPDLYGDRIIIERKLTISNGSSYRIMNENKKKISDKRVELANILDHMDIQVDNPCAILSQDTSREFLQAKGKQAEKQKYAFFERATSLDVIKNHVEVTESNVSTMEQAKSDCETRLKKAKLVFDTAKEEMEEAEKIGKLKEDKQKVVARLAWRVVAESEGEYDQLKTNLEKFQKRRADLLKELEDEQGNNLQETLNGLNEKLDNVAGLIAEKKAEQDALGHRYSGLNKKIKSYKDRVGRIEARITALTKQLKQQEREAERWRLDAQRDRQHEMAEYENTVSRIQGDIERLEGERRELETRMDESDTMVERCNQEFRGIQQNLREAQTARKKQASRIGQLQKAQSDTTYMFGAETVKLVKEVERNARLFHQKPVGPLGAYIQVREARYAPAVEKCVKIHMLKGFLVTDNHDRAELVKIIRRVFRGDRLQQPNIFVQQHSNAMYNGLRRAEHPDYPTVYDAVKISNNWVARLLINQSQLEAYLIADERGDASASTMSYMKRNRNDQKLRGIFLLDGRLCTKRGVGTIYWQGGDKIKNPVLTTDVSRTLEEAKDALKAAEDDERRAAEVVESRKHEVNDLKKQQKTIRNALNKVVSALKRAANDLEKAEAYKPEEPDMDHCRMLEQEVEETKAELDERKCEHEDGRKAYEALKGEVEEYRMEKGAVKDALKKLIDTQLSVKREFKEFSEKFARRKVRADRKKKVLKDTETNIEQCASMLEEALVDIVQKRKLTMENFGELKEPLDDKETSAVLSKRSKRLDAQIAEIERVMGRSDAEIKEQFYTAQQAYDRAQLEQNQLARNTKRLRIGALARSRDLQAFRLALATNATSYFNLYLSQQGHSGSLDFDHDAKTVGIEVTTYTNQAGADESKRRSTTDTQSLSGGERSSSTLAFIMALSEAMETPFRAMDEFDIFMDTLNRKKSMDALVKAAKGALHRQFIFITPLGSASIKHDKYMKIFELKAPDRTQGTID